MKYPSKIESVCFTGHRDLTDAEIATITDKLSRLLQILITTRGLSSCYAGGAVGLDTVAALSVLSIKEKYPQLTLNLILPCAGQERSWDLKQKAVYYDIQNKADSVRVLSPFFYNGCMHIRNRELLLCSDLCIAYLRPGTGTGGSLNTVIQASKLGIPVINLADPESEYIYEISQ